MIGVGGVSPNYNVWETLVWAPAFTEIGCSKLLCPFQVENFWKAFGLRRGEKHGHFIAAVSIVKPLSTKSNCA